MAIVHVVVMSLRGEPLVEGDFARVEVFAELSTRLRKPDHQVKFYIGADELSASSSVEGVDVVVTAIFLKLSDEERSSCREALATAPADHVARVVESFSEVARADPELMLDAVAREAAALPLVAGSLRDDAGFMRRALFTCTYTRTYSWARGGGMKLTKHVEFRYGALRHAGERLRDDAKFMKEAVKADHRAVGYASARLRGDVSFMKSALASSLLVIEHASAGLLDDAAFMRSACKTGAELTFTRLSARLRDDGPFMIAMVKNHAQAVGYASERLREDAALMKLAMAKDVRLVRYAGERLQDDARFMLAAAKQARSVQVGSSVLSHASDRLKLDEDFVQKFMAIVQR